MLRGARSGFSQIDVNIKNASPYTFSITYIRAGIIHYFIGISLTDILCTKGPRQTRIRRMVFGAPAEYRSRFPPPK